MKKILCLIDGLGSGGAQRQLTGLAALLKDRGYDVLFVWYHKSDFYKNFLDDNGVNYEQIHATNLFQKFWCIRKVIAQFCPDAVVAYIDGPNMATCLMKMLGMKSIAIVSERNLTQTLRWKAKLKFFLYRWADHVVSNSQAQTDFINSHFPSLKKKTTTIRNFVDSDSFRPLEREVSTTNEKKKILVVGRIAYQKNIIRFMRALKKAKDAGAKFHVDWYGRVSVGQGKYSEEVQRVYDELGLSECVYFHEPTGDILHKYRGCDFFCLPSLNEGFPNVICEAMSCGKPILCSDVADNAVLVHEGRNGILFNPLSIDDMADKISLLCRKSNLELCEMGKESRNIVLDDLSKEKFVQRYIDII